MGQLPIRSSLYEQVVSPTTDLITPHFQQKTHFHDEPNMITGISITNFKSIGDPGIRLELAPLTLLFGHNSAGKSTIFHALLYSYEVLINGNYDVDRTSLGGANIDLGGFRNFVHNRDLNRTVSLEFDLDLASATLDQDWRIAEFLIGEGENQVDLSAIGSDCWTATIGFEIKWDQVSETAFLSAFRVSVDGEPLFETSIEKPSELAMAKINYRHPSFRWPNAENLQDQSSAGVLDAIYPEFQTLSDRRFWEVAVEIESEDIDESRESRAYEKMDFGFVPDRQSDLKFRRVVRETVMGSDARYFYRYDTESQKAVLEGATITVGNIFGKEFAQEEWMRHKLLEQTDAQTLIRLLEQKDALPAFDRPLQLLIDPNEVKDEDIDIIRDIVSRLTLGPAKLLANELNRFRHIGPLREVPTRNFNRSMTPTRERWNSGLAAWDTLFHSDDNFLSMVSDWLNSDNKLATGYSLLRKRFVELDVESYVFRLLQEENVLDTLSTAVEGLNDLEIKSRIVINDESTLTELEPPDIAIGLVQLIPVIVAALDRHKGITLIEQPEIHNHPKVEVGLGDLFAKTIDQQHCRFILETHGEHLLLRLLRRIRETKENELPDDVKPLLPDQVAVYFIQRSPDGANAQRLRIDEYGEFIDKWPGGFFRERAEELF